MHGNIKVMEHDMMLAFEKAFRNQSREIQEARRPAYGSLHQMLAGSYFVAGNYPAFIKHSIKSLYFDPGNISYYLKFGRGPRNRRGVKA